MIPVRVKGWYGIGLCLGLAAVLAFAARGWLRPDPDRLIARVHADYTAGRFQAARDSLAELGRLRAPTPADRMLRAQVARALGDDPLLELALIPEGDPRSPTAHLLAGRVEVSRNRLRAAEVHFLATLAGEPKATQARRELAYIYALQHRMHALDEQFRALSGEGQLDARYLLIWGRVRNGIWNPEADMDTLRKVVAADPDDRFSRLALAEGLIRFNQPDEAERMLAPLPSSDPEARVQRFAIATARGDQQAAESLLSESPESDNPGLLHLRGTLALSRHDLPAAVRYLRDASAADPEDRATQFGLGTALKLSGQEAEAEPYLDAARNQDAVGELMRRAALATGDRDPTLPTRLGLACARANRVDEARAWLNLAVNRNPLDTQAQEALFRLNRSRAHPKE